MDEYIGMIKTFAGYFVPYGYFECDGRSLRINEFAALYTLIGTRYGGDGETYFNLPDLRSRSIIGTGDQSGLTPQTLGEAGGVEQVMLTQSQIPPHNHPYNALTGPRESKDPTNNYIGSAGGNFYARKDWDDKLIQMNQNMISQAPSKSLPHNNMAPFLCITYAICWKGEYPPRPD